MYFPFMRGKQFELKALREIANAIKDKCIPIIEPVKINTKPLETAIMALNKSNIIPIVIVNPEIGELKDKPQHIENTLTLNKGLKFIPCLKYSGDVNLMNSRNLSDYAIYVESGVNKEFIQLVKENNPIYTIMPEASPKIVLQSTQNIVVISDPFQKKKRNADYPIKSFYSDIHTRYSNISEHVIGFSDFTIVGSDFAESGGPAYVVTIHVSHIDQDGFDAMSIKHYSSQDDQSTSNPGGKFLQALTKLVTEHQNNPKLFDNTIGLQGFKSLHSQRHYPGLGEVKKLSMEHHIETITNYIQ